MQMLDYQMVPTVDSLFFFARSWVAIVLIDTQCRGFSLPRGDANLYLKCPVSVVAPHVISYSSHKNKRAESHLKNLFDVIRNSFISPFCNWWASMVIFQTCHQTFEGYAHILKQRKPSNTLLKPSGIMRVVRSLCIHTRR